MNPRAIEYRKLNKLSDDMGTAVNVQAMVFGNMGEDSGTGVLFTRNPSTGASFVMGEFLTNAQGEDVVAGIRTPMSLDKMMDLHLNEEHEADNPAGNNLWCLWPGIRQQLVLISAKLEKAYKDMVDLEFTVQKGELFILQSRTGKRSARAAFKIAVDLVEEGMITKAVALTRLTPDQFKAVRRPMIDPSFKEKPHFTGLPACPGVAKGRPVFSAKEAVAATDPVILVTHETNPDDIAGMAKALGILTQTGGATSHAAVVARAMDKPCVVGCTDLIIDNGLIGGFKSGGVAKTNDDVTIDGATGNVWVGVDVKVIDASDDPAVKTVTNWCLEDLNAAESLPVSCGMQRPHCVRAAYWWGNEVVLDAVLADLEGLPSRGHIMLDLSPPFTLTPPVDALLDTCFGLAFQTGFVAFVVEELTARSEKLKGLRIEELALGNVQVQQLSDAGFKIGWNSGQKAMPADYAVFTALSR
jgi:pyruvate,orthophosphate dikinase